MDDAFRQSLSLSDDAILEHLPYLHQDIWSLGGHPALAVEVMARHLQPEAGFRAIDLGCGKGATLAALAQRFPGQYLGIDLVEAFIDEGRQRLQPLELNGQVVLERGDIRQITAATPYDLVFHGYDSDALGPWPQALEFLASLKKPAGHLLVESCFKDEHTPDPDGDYISRQELEDGLARSGLEVLEYATWEQAFLIAENRMMEDSFRQRVGELQQRYPEKSAHFERFLAQQVEENQVLNAHITCVTLLLR